MNAEIRSIKTVRGPVRLGTARRATVYAIAAGAWITGVLWLLFHYFVRRPTEFGFEIHPLEPWWLKLHGAFAFGAMWTVGLLSASHIVSGWASGQRRWSGVLLLTFVSILIATGYLLYYAGNEFLRNCASYVHWILGIFGPVVLLFHRLRVFRRQFSKADT